MDTKKLQKLWQEAFPGAPRFTRLFFRHGFHPDRFQAIWEGNVPVAALYWFDCTYEGRKLAYLYGVATAMDRRGQGLCRRLMEMTHETLRQQGYSGSILSPARPGLFAMYEKMGYRTCGYVEEFECDPGAALPMTRLTGPEYAQRRRAWLPSGGVAQEGALLTYLGSWCEFYAGEDFLVAGFRDKKVLYVQELLGDRRAAPGITAAWKAEQGCFRIPGGDKPFAMYLPLDDRPAPTYLGLAMD